MRIHSNPIAAAPAQLTKIEIAFLGVIGPRAKPVTQIPVNPANPAAPTLTHPRSLAKRTPLTTCRAPRSNN